MQELTSSVRRIRNRAIVRMIHHVSPVQVGRARGEGQGARGDKEIVRQRSSSFLSRATGLSPRVPCQVSIPVCDAPARIMWAVSFTFKYLPNIIQKFCTHVAVGDACALSASVAHISNLLCRHHHTLPVCVVCDWVAGARCAVTARQDCP